MWFDLEVPKVNTISQIRLRISGGDRQQHGLVIGVGLTDRHGSGDFAFGRYGMRLPMFCASVRAWLVKKMDVCGRKTASRRYRFGLR